ncbi:hypothetical protein [Pseudoduganella lutea]|uniref:hypothetical protein n=1 Tax=Pseudoduganella lutea TaxID=321985 RepID=UPI0013EEA28F|nr:hypothetical protein [Pseudoduganella lutea]
MKTNIIDPTIAAGTETYCCFYPADFLRLPQINFLPTQIPLPSATEPLSRGHQPVPG